MASIKYPPIPEPPKWCSYVYGRNPEFKIHKNLGQAKNAIGIKMYGSGVRGGRIFEWACDAWWLKYDVKPGTPKEELPWRNND